MGEMIPEKPLAAKALPADAAQRAVEFLEGIATGSGRVAVATIRPSQTAGGKDVIQGVTLELPKDRKALLSVLEQAQAHPVNLYFTLNDPKPPEAQDGKAGKLKEADVEAIRGVAVDIDPDEAAEAEPGGFERERDRLKLVALEALADPACPATAAIDSGNGVQLLWLFDKPLPNTPENREAVKRQAAGLAQHFGGDAVQSLEHLFRIPFTRNIPNRKKREKGRTERPTGLFAWNNQHRHSLEALATIAPPADQVSISAQAVLPVELDFPSVMEAAEGGPDALPQPLQPWAAMLRERRGFASAMEKQDRSARDFELTANCVAMGMNDPTEIAQVVFAFSPEKMLEEEETRGLGERHASRTVAKALATTQRDPRPQDFFEPVEMPTGAQGGTEAAQHATAEQPATLPDLCVVSGVVEAANLPVRQWVIYPRFPLGDVAQIVGEPGVSKSTFAIRDALALATGRRDIIEGRDAHGNPVSPERIHRTGPVIIYNAEDRLDEMKRRLVAAQRHFGIRPEDMKHPVILWSGVDMQHLTILEVTDKGPKIADGAATLRRYLSRHRPVLVYLDTQLSLKRGGNENATDDQDALMQELARIAAEAGTAICTIHHTSKSTTLNRGDMGAGRGAFSAVGKVRAAFTLCRVTGAAPDERRMGMTADEELIVLDYAKLSAGKKPESGIFLRRVDTPVGNGAGEPGTAEAAAYFSEDPAEALRLRGDNAPVLDLVDVRSRGAVPDEVRNAEDEAEKRRIALIVADLLDGERECQLSMIWEAAGERMRRERLTNAKARAGVAAALTGALAAPGVGVEHKGQNVLIKAFRKGEGRTAAWFVARFEGGA